MAEKTIEMKSCKWIVRLIAASFVCGVLAFWIFPPLNTLLGAYGIPRIPESAVVENTARGGLLCKWLYARVRMTEPDFKHYMNQFQQQKRKIGRGKGEFMIAGLEEMDANYSYLPEADIINMAGYEGIRDWWRPNLIAEGCLFQLDSGAEGWLVCFDSRKCTVYIYWHDS